MADDIVTRLRELMADLLYNPDCDDEGCGDCAWHRIGADAIAEIERLRAAIDSLLADIDTYHRPVWVVGRAKATGKQPWCCALCGATDGEWPCIHRRALDKLKEARRG